MQRDSHASLEWIFFSKKKKKKKKLMQASSPWYCPQMASFQQWVSFVPRWYLGRALTAEGASWFFLLGLRSSRWTQVYTPKKILWHLEYPFILWEIRCTHASILDSCEKSQVYIRIIKIHCDHSENTFL